MVDMGILLQNALFIACVIRVNSEGGWDYCATSMLLPVPALPIGTIWASMQPSKLVGEFLLFFFFTLFDLIFHPHYIDSFKQKV